MANSVGGTGKMVGAEVRRVEDPRVLLGKTQYVDDLALPETVAVAFVRSPYAHARITHIDTSAAQSHPGILTVLTGADIADTIKPLRVEVEASKNPTHKSCDWPVLAQGKVRLVGDLVAAVVATDRYIAEDAAALVEVDYDPLDAVWDPEQALAPNAPLVHEEWGDNLMETLAASIGDVDTVFQEADCVVTERFTTGRHMALPMETRGCVAQFEAATDAFTVWSSTQTPHVLRSSLSRLLNVPEQQIRAIAPDVGGGFGLKASTFPEEIVTTFLSRQLGRPVKWIEDRREHLSASLHAKQQIVDAELALTKSGIILGFRGHFLSDAGSYSAYPWTSSFEVSHAAFSIPGPYKIPAFQVETKAVATNKASVGAYRGVGLPIAILTMERLIDMAAEKLEIDPAELRLKNMIRNEDHPYTNIIGSEIESGSHQEALQKALDMLRYQHFRVEQEQARQAGRYIGVGIGSYVEGTAPGSEVMQSSGVSVVGGDEGVAIRVETDGIVTVLTGTSSHGQGHATTLAQMTADELGVPMTTIKIVQGDTAVVPHGWGTWGSRSAVVSGGAIAIAAKELRGDILQAASRLSEIPPADLEMVDGIILRRQDGSQVVTLTALAQSLPAQLEAATRYEPPASTHSNATHIATVEVDIETGQVKLLRYIVVEDCGTMLNPLIVEGQIQGGVAQGIGMALYEHAIYDENGQFLTGTLMDYLIPTAADVPEVEIAHLESPSPYVPSGIKGMGEGGAIAPPAAIANAVSDALRPFGVQVNTVPLTPEQVLTLLDRAQAGNDTE